MSNNCECDKPVVKIPLRGLELALDSEALGNFGGNGINYSFEEQWTGKYWVNGKKIYQKTYSLGTMPSNNTKNTPTGADDIEMIVGALAFTKSTAGDVKFLPYSSSAASGIMLIVCSPLQITLVTYSTAAAAYVDTWATIQYTKSTD